MTNHGANFAWLFQGLTGRESLSFLFQYVIMFALVVRRSNGM
ncbi:hypothetical protein ABIE50_002432 [Chitinophaga sp. OAE865]